MVGYLQPLDEKFPIVGPDGKPTLYFIRWAQQKQLDIGEARSGDQVQALIDQFMEEHQLREGSGIILTPDGNLLNSPEISADAQEILDQLSTTQGSVLFRGAAGWEALPPGASTQYLKSGGPSANPLWGTPAGGGGGGILPFWVDPLTPPVASDFTLIKGATVTGDSVADTARGLRIAQNSDSGVRMMLVDRSDLPTTGDWYIEALIHKSFPTSASNAVGVYIRDVVLNRTRAYVIGEFGLAIQNWSGLTAFGGLAINRSVDTLSPATIRIRKVSTTIHFDVSYDGETFTSIYSAPGTDYTTNPTNWGFFFNGEHSAFRGPSAFTVMSCKTSW